MSIPFSEPRTVWVQDLINCGGVSLARHWRGLTALVMSNAFQVINGPVTGNAKALNTGQTPPAGGLCLRRIHFRRLPECLTLARTTTTNVRNCRIS